MRSVLFASLFAIALAAGDPSPAAEQRSTGPAPAAMPRLAREVFRAAAPLSADRPDRDAPADKAPASLRAVLLMCDFADSLMFGRFGQVDGEFPPPMQDEISYSAHDVVYFDHLLQDVADYFADASSGAFTLDWTVHPRVVNLPHGMAWYGDHPDEGEQHVRLAADVVDSLDAEVDFSLYDTVVLVHAGAGEETDVLGDSPEQIISTYLDPDDFAEAYEDSVIEQPWLVSDDYPPDRGIDRVLVLPETLYQDPMPPGSIGMYGSLGVYCYEFGLRLGMLPLVDLTPAGRPDSQGIGSFGLMGYGLFVFSGWSPPPPSAYNRALMGWIDPYPADPAADAVHALEPSATPGSALACARVDLTGQEYWLLEYRLQDPDGDRSWSFGGDLNGDFRRNFVDASEADGIPRPGAKFDAAEDTRERLVGAEWDFFTTEFETGFGGTGSGVLVWHVDEGVISEVAAAGSSHFNGDPARKAVDLEEADGIQDLDDSSFSRYYLGTPRDVFRGEGATRFGPDALPRTATNSGVRTGIVFDGFTPVVNDSTAFIVGIDTYEEGGVTVSDTVWGIDFADTVRFSLSFESAAEGPIRGAERALPAGVDLRGSHALVVDLDGGGGEIVLADRAGGVHVFTGELAEFLDGDTNPDTYAAFATGTRDGTPVAWNLPPAVGDVDGDGTPEIVLTGPDGLFAFERDGTGTRDLEPMSEGLYADLGACAVPPVLVPRLGDPVPEEPGPADPVSAVVVVTEGGRSWLRTFHGPDAALEIEHDLGAVLVRAPPVFAFGRFWVAAVDTTAAGEHRLLECLRSNVGIPGAVFVRRHDLEIEPGHFPPAWGYEAPGDPDSRGWLAVAGRAGGGETVLVDAAGSGDGTHFAWPAEVVVRSPQAAGGAFLGPEVLGRVGAAGDWLDGWPRRPRLSVTTEEAPWTGGPVTARIIGSGRPVEDTLFPLADGRLVALAAKGEEIAGWPVAAPARTAATPALGRVAGGTDADLVTVAALERISGVDDLGEEFERTVQSVLTVWEDVAVTGGSWPMWGGGPWRCGIWPADDWRRPEGGVGGEGIVSGSHICYPSPLTGATLQVRARLQSAGRVLAEIYDLEGELVTRTGWRDVTAGEPFSVPVQLDGIASGMYLCRLVARHAAGGEDHSVVAFAVAR